MISKKINLPIGQKKERFVLIGAAITVAIAVKSMITCGVHLHVGKLDSLPLMLEDHYKL